MKIFVLFAMLLFVFSSCENEPEKLRIRIEPQAIFVNNKKVVNTADIEKQNNLFIEELDNAIKALRDKGKIYEKCEIQIVDPSQRNSVFSAVWHTKRGFDDVSITSKINGKIYTESLSTGKNLDSLVWPNAKKLALTVFISDEYFQIEARKHSFKIPVAEPTDFTYDSLARALITIRNNFINSPDIDVIIIANDGDYMNVSKIIRVMHAARVSGFTKRPFVEVSRHIYYDAPATKEKKWYEEEIKDIEDFVDKIKSNKDKYEAYIKSRDSLNDRFFNNLGRVMDSLRTIREMKKK